MKRFVPAALATFACLIVIGSYPGHGQRPLIKNRTPGLRTRAADEGATRQVEVQRLEKMINGLESRVRRLERQPASYDSFPAITIDESVAALDVAQKEFDAATQGLADGTATELEVARDRLALARARNQLLIVRASYADRAIALESDVAYATRQFVEQQRQQAQFQRLVARGFSSGEGLELKIMDVGLAKKQLERANARLKLHEQLAGTAEPPAKKVELAAEKD